MYCNKNQLPALPFGGSHPKPHGSRGSSKHYHLRFDPKLGRGICAICRISFACVECTSMLDQPWIYGIPFKNKHATNLSQAVMGSYNNWNIIHITLKLMPFRGI